jgi:uncharacterized glyoxalase superfamily protein PhnB
VTVRALIPSFAYEDAPAAIAFLCSAFGFEEHAVYEGEPGTIMHAQLKLGPHFIMLGSAGKNPDWPSNSPQQLGGATGGVAVVFESDADVEAHYEHARAAGATIIRGLETPEYGGLNYSAVDTEGYLWNFGSFRPEAAP